MSCHKVRHRLTRRPILSPRRWTQIYHIVICYWWRLSIEDSGCSWSTSVDSDHVLVCPRFCFCLVCGHTSTKAAFLAQLILDDDHRLQLQLSPQQNAQGLSERWEQINETLHSVATVTQNFLSHKAETMNFLDFSCPVGCLQICSPDATYSETRMSLRRQQTKGLRSDH